MTEMCTAAANYIINEVNRSNAGKAQESQVIMSSKRLQKLLYFSDALYMVENKGTSMFSDDFYAWPSGPVIPSVYRRFMQYQDGDMRPYTGEIHETLTQSMRIAMMRVLGATKSLDTIELIRESHVDGGPWHSVYDEDSSDFNRIISKESIYLYYYSHGVPYGAQ